MIEIHPQSLEALADMRRSYLDALIVPLDGMWEAFAEQAEHREIRFEGQRAGYFCFNDQGRLLQFFVEPEIEPRAAGIFARIVALDEVQGAVVGTGDPLFLAFSLDHQKSLRAQTLLYADHAKSTDTSDSFADAESSILRPIELAELEDIARLQEEALGQELGDWLRGYLDRLIRRRELFALCLDDQILGTGEIRVSDSQEPYADLGVITMKDHRGRGVAGHVLTVLKKSCYPRELTPICSTTVDNIAAQKAIARAGFVSKHRLLEVEF